MTVRALTAPLHAGSGGGRGGGAAGAVVGVFGGVGHVTVSVSGVLAVGVVWVKR